MPLGVASGYGFAPMAIPGVTVASLRFDFGDVILLQSVTAGKDGAVGLDLIEARPKWRSALVLHDSLVPIHLLLPQAVEPRSFKPSRTGVDGAEPRANARPAYGAVQRRFPLPSYFTVS